MAVESNHWGNVGLQNGSRNPSEYKRHGASDTQAAEAAAAAARAAARKN